jgi:adenine-specific DNA-methyltransferase
MLPLNNRNFKIEQGNAFDLIKRVKPGSVTLTVTSPPYNIGKVYEKRTALQKYLSQFTEFADDLYKATSEDGSLCGRWEITSKLGKYIH